MTPVTHDPTTRPDAGPRDAILRDAGLDRRDFLRAAGIGGAAVALAACGADHLVSPQTLASTNPAAGGASATSSSAPGVVLDFSSDVGVLNYAYALEQLEAAFYTQVAASFYSGITTQERQLLTDVRDHEVIHREFFKAALGSAAIPGLTVNFSSIDFTSRASVLGTAKAFEDLGVTAYNGAAHYLRNAAYLTIAGKIVSVEARHASAIRDLLNPRSSDFAPNVVDPANPPATVLGIAGKYVTNSITLKNA